MAFETYEFSAFRESDLTTGGKSKFFVGNTIVVPTAPTLSIRVTDDDGALSGDNIVSEAADDASGQTASILDASGNEIGNGGKIYGEVFFWVSDAEGNRYALVEIEQEGGGDDYFAFVTDYGLPKAGTALTVDTKVSIKNKTLIPEYSSLTADVPEPDPAPADEFEFTAFNEFDLLTVSGKKNLFVGDTIVLPELPTLLITVTDDEGNLSGDNLVNEQADDETFQTATVINMDGEEVGNGGQIFGEVYYWVKDSAGKRYRMVEIEQEGSEDDYFAFLTSHGVPAVGEELYVAAKRNIKDSKILVDYEDLTTGDPAEHLFPDPGDLIL